jgi:hypothetical protein
MAVPVDPWFRGDLRALVDMARCYRLVVRVAGRVGETDVRDDGVVVEMKKEVHGRQELDGRIVKTYDLVKTSNMSGRLMT